MSEQSKYVITIGRSFGAGGRALGKMLAEKLGIAYYDKELLGEAAEKAGLSKSLFERNDERAPGILGGLASLSIGYSAISWYTSPGGTTADTVYKAQSEFIRRVASEGPCVIVGRTADYILRDYPNVFNIFLHAPEDSCIARILSRNDCCDEERARAALRRTNKLRAEYYNYYTDRHWGQADSYHLTVDSSTMPMDTLADFIIQYLKIFLTNNTK
ncbi:MAG: AAA family ATPase [Muribaculaceae bacterium]